MAIQRIGIYGGTFDPIHNGHVEVSRSILKNFGLDFLLLVPAARPPHKKSVPISDPYHRYTMAVLGTLDIDRIIVSTMEMEQPEQPYTYQTLARLRERYPSSTMFFILGSDSFEELDSWREPVRILKAANVVVAARPGYEMKNNRLLRMLAEAKTQAKPGDYDDHSSYSVEDLRTADSSRVASLSPGPGDGRKTGGIFLTNYTWRDVSSTEVRERSRRSLSVREIVPALVADYIEKYRVYDNTENDGPNS